MLATTVELTLASQLVVVGEGRSQGEQNNDRDERGPQKQGRLGIVTYEQMNLKEDEGNGRRNDPRVGVVIGHLVVKVRNRPFVEAVECGAP